MLLVLSLVFAQAAFAEDCANTIAGLKNLVGNADAPLRWKENGSKNPLNLDLSSGSGVINLQLTTAKGKWADVAGVVCKTGPDSYVARVSSMTWGPAAPGMAKMAKISQIKLKMPYQSLLKVSVSFFSFEFSPR